MPARAELSVITFSNPPGVPTGHLPDTGGILTPTSQNFSEAGFHVEAFWVPNSYTAYQRRHWATGFRPDGHFHQLVNGYETSHGFQTNTGAPGADIQGIYLRRLDGGSFSIESLDYSILTMPQGTNIRITTDFDPLNPSATVWRSFAVTQQTGFRTLEIDGFDNVDQLFITADLGVNQLHRLRYDNIVLNAAVAPVPGPILLGALGLGLVAWRRRKS